MIKLEKLTFSLHGSKFLKVTFAALSSAKLTTNVFCFDVARYLFLLVKENTDSVRLWGKCCEIKS